ncbi:MAG: thiamine pyrophosphate-binding protein [Thermomicrobiales bacterium]
MTIVDVATEPIELFEPSSKENAAEAAIHALEEMDVDTVFGIPGVHTLALYDALRSSVSIRHILARHEQGAGFMADGYARATGKPGVALVITGPGVTNISTAVGQAYTDSSPMLVLSTNVERKYLDGMRGSLHDLKDQPRLMSTLTKWNTRVTSPEQVGPTLIESLLHASKGRPGPVHVEIPKDILDESIDAVTFDIYEVDPAELDTESVNLAIEALRNARRPVVYAGGGVIAAGAHLELMELAERLNAPVVTSIQGKGSLPETHPQSLGALWSPGNPIDHLVRNADCMIVVGSKLGVQSTEHFTFPFPDTLIRIDIDPNEMIRNVQPSIEIHCDARAALLALESGIDRIASEWSIAEIQLARSSAENDAFGADRVAWLEAIRCAMPDDGIVAWDMTMMSYVACGLYKVTQPRTWLFPHGFGTLGFALPAAIGAKLGKPDTAVACVVGDGGFQFTMQEVATAVQYRIGLPIVIFNDSAYSAVKDEQARTREGNFIAVDLVNPDYVKLADAYGIAGIRATSPEILEREIEAALNRDLPTIIDVPIAGWA